MANPDLKLLSTDALKTIVKGHLLWTKAPSKGKRGDLSYCALPGINVAGLDLHGMILAGADLSGADLGGCDLSDCDFFGSNLANANLRKAKLSRAVSPELQQGGMVVY